jgi:hypothetical protein
MQALNDKRGMHVCIWNGLLLLPSKKSFLDFDQYMQKFAAHHKGRLSQMQEAYFYLKHGFTLTHIGAPPDNSVEESQD